MQNRHTFLLTALLAAGCAGRERVVIEPVVVTREVIVVRPLPDALLITGPAEESTSLRDCPTVARERLHDLRACYNRLLDIKAIQQETPSEHEGKDPTPGE